MGIRLFDSKFFDPLITFIGANKPPCSMVTNFSDYAWTSMEAFAEAMAERKRSASDYRKKRKSLQDLEAEEAVDPQDDVPPRTRLCERKDQPDSHERPVSRKRHLHRNQCKLMDL